jgi:uncharacterized membrane protein YeaQ/YmgE (transglycosylase-associated protein family)
MPSKVFISYRREDSKYQARGVYDAFQKVLPRDSIFMDVDSIPPGTDFVAFLEGWVDKCEILLALIGSDWSKSIDPKTGRRRLDNPRDFVRIEIREALTRGIPVVPVLLDGASIPDVNELPDDMKNLIRRQAEYIEYRTFDADVTRLVNRLQLSRGTSPLRPVTATDKANGQNPSVSGGAARSPADQSLTLFLISWMVIGGVVGWLLALVFKAPGSVAGAYIIFGIIGALVGGFTFRKYKIGYSILAATMSAIIVVYLEHVLLV